MRGWGDAANGGPDSNPSGQRDVCKLGLRSHHSERSSSALCSSASYLGKGVVIEMTRWSLCVALASLLLMAPQVDMTSVDADIAD